MRNGAMTMISIGTMVKTATASPSRALAFRPLEAMRARPPRMTRLRIRFRVNGSMAAIDGIKPAQIDADDHDEDRQTGGPDEPVGPGAEPSDHFAPIVLTFLAVLRFEDLLGETGNAGGVGECRCQLTEGHVLQEPLEHRHAPQEVDAPHSSPVVNPMLGMIASGMPIAIRNPCFQSMQR